MANFTKFFRNGKTFSAFCRYRYGNSQQVWSDETLWEKSGKYAIAFDIEAADAKFGVKEHSESNQLKPSHCEAAWDDENYAERRMEAMMDYIHSGAGLQAYYEDRDAGYTY